jgi:glycosyltransferase involved in cell wall biosynthesis
MASVSQTTDVKLVLAGSLDDREYVDFLRAETRRLDIEQQVDFAGILDEKRLLEELSRAAVLVLPSYQETAPMVIQEAMASGVPVIATKVGGTSYQIVDEESGFLVDAGDVGALTDRLTRLFSNDDLRLKIGRTAKERASDDFRAINVAKATIEVYRKIIAGG